MFGISAYELELFLEQQAGNRSVDKDVAQKYWEDREIVVHQEIAHNA